MSLVAVRKLETTGHEIFLFESRVIFLTIGGSGGLGGGSFGLSCRMNRWEAR